MSDISRADGLARSIANTTKSYHGGFMTKPTYEKHVKSLWGTVDHLGLRPQVEARLVLNVVSIPGTAPGVKTSAVIADILEKGGL